MGEKKPPKYVCPLIAVENIDRSRQFYEQILGQQVKMDFGENITFHGDFAIHLKDHFMQLLGGKEKYPTETRAHNGELYFEAEEIEEVHQLLKQHGIEFIHELQEQPWGQRVMRFFDPDGHIIEIGEQLEAVIRRFHEQGLSIQEISKRSSMPEEFVVQSIGEEK